MRTSVYEHRGVGLALNGDGHGHDGLGLSDGCWTRCGCWTRSRARFGNDRGNGLGLGNRLGLHDGFHNKLGLYRQRFRNNRLGDERNRVRLYVNGVAHAANNTYESHRNNRR